VIAVVQGDEEAQRRGFYLDGDATRGGNRGPRGKRANANRLRQLPMTCRGVSKRAAMTSLDRPRAAKRTILARITSRSGDVYLRTLASNSSCSSVVAMM